MGRLSPEKVKDLTIRLCAFERAVFLVCDGAVMHNIYGSFAELRLNATPLFVGKLEKRIVDAGPWMISIPKPYKQLQEAIFLAVSHGVGVCWVADCSSSEMVHHLRGLNIGRLPDGSICYFRHYDPSVLAWLAERLDSDQAARFLGQAVGIGLASGTAAGAIIDRPDALPPVKPGPMAFSQAQLLAMHDRDALNSRLRIKDFLRWSYPAEAQRVSDDEIMDFISEREQKARTYGLESERQIALWSHASVRAARTPTTDKLLAEKIRVLTET